MVCFSYFSLVDGLFQLLFIGRWFVSVTSHWSMVYFSYFSLVDGLRRGPTSYSHLSYYSQFAYRFTPKDEHQRAARFRLIPYGGQGQLRLVWYFLSLIILRFCPVNICGMTDVLTNTIAEPRWLCAYVSRNVLHPWVDGCEFNSACQRRLYRYMAAIFRYCFVYMFVRWLRLSI